MPELPEVETVRLGLEVVAIGREVTDVVVTGRRTIRRQPPAEFIELLRGRRLVAARRVGKYLIIDLDDEAVLVVHLRMSGQLRHLRPDEPLQPHTHVVLQLDDGSELRFVDPRTFGELFVTDELDEARRPLALVRIGPDALDPSFARAELSGRLARRRTALKAFLLDQSAIAGIGNIYADEICFSARLLPMRRTESLSAAEIGRLVRAIRAVLAKAVERRGSSLRDGRYRDLFGGLGDYQLHHAVYDRAGGRCRRCGGPIERTRIAGRSSYYCPKCQH